jgi:hypothetical protein
MSILKTRSPKTLLSVCAEQDQRSKRQAVRADGAGRSKIRTESNWGSVRPFGEDFNSEHSLYYTLVAFSAISSSVEPETRKGPNQQDFRSPSCVYLG